MSQLWLTEERVGRTYWCLTERRAIRLQAALPVSASDPKAHTTRERRFPLWRVETWRRKF